MTTEQRVRASPKEEHEMWPKLHKKLVSEVKILNLCLQDPEWTQIENVTCFGAMSKKTLKILKSDTLLNIEHL